MTKDDESPDESYGQPTLSLSSSSMPKMRLLEVILPDGTSKAYEAHSQVVLAGVLYLVEYVLEGGELTTYYRHLFAPNAWAQVHEIIVSPTTATLN